MLKNHWNTFQLKILVHDTLIVHVLEQQQNHDLFNLLISNWLYKSIALNAVIWFLIKTSSIGVILSWSMAFKDAPFWRSKGTNSSWLSIRAKCRGVFKLVQFWFTIAPFLMRNSAISFCLYLADCISQCSCNIPCFPVSRSIIFDQCVEHMPEKIPEICLAFSEQIWP